MANKVDDIAARNLPAFEALMAALGDAKEDNSPTLFSKTLNFLIFDIITLKFLFVYCVFVSLPCSSKV